MSEPRALSEIAAEMETLAEGKLSEEAGHHRADALLVEAIERLAPHSTEHIAEAESERIISAFKRVFKWYA